MAKRPVEILPFDGDVRSARRGAVVGAVVGVVVFAVVLLRYGGSAREVVGGLMVCVGGGATFGAVLPLGPATRFIGARPSHRGRFLLLLLGITVVGLGTVLLGAFIAGFTGER
jgi:hypothetical protein